MIVNLFLTKKLLRGKRQALIIHLIQTEAVSDQFKFILLRKSNKRIQPKPKSHNEFIDQSTVATESDHTSLSKLDL